MFLVSMSHRFTSFANNYRKPRILPLFPFVTMFNVWNPEHIHIPLLNELDLVGPKIIDENKM